MLRRSFAWVSSVAVVCIASTTAIAAPVWTPAADPWPVGEARVYAYEVVERHGEAVGELSGEWRLTMIRNDQARREFVVDFLNVQGHPRPTKIYRLPALVT